MMAPDGLREHGKGTIGELIFFKLLEFFLGELRSWLVLKAIWKKNKNDVIFKDQWWYLDMNKVE